MPRRSCVCCSRTAPTSRRSPKTTPRSASRRGEARPASRNRCARPYVPGVLDKRRHETTERRVDKRMCPMAKGLSLTLAAMLLVGATITRADETFSADALRKAAERGLDLLVKTSPAFIKQGGCNSCHNQMLPAAAQAFARTRGIVSEPAVAVLPFEQSDATMERYAEYSIAGGAGVNAMTFELFAADLTRTPIDPRIRAQIRYIKAQQQADGHWRGGSGSLVNNAQQALSRPAAARPPLNFDP